MRASRAGLTGAEGQAAVEKQFVRLGWGVARNPIEHDLGTDLWLMARDSRLFDLGALVGAQVKGGDSWFDEPAYDGENRLIGWWFRDSDKHFKYWKGHNVPHILVLHDLGAGISYWVPTTHERFVSTGKGWKILVPVDSAIDEEHIAGLLDVATGNRTPARWEGSVFGSSEPILGSDRLRHALLTPRLIAPHPNLTVTSYQPEEALAILTKMRVSELLPSRSPYQATVAPDLSTCRESPDWRWRFYAATHDSLVSGVDSTAIQDLAGAEDAAPHEWAAAAAVAAALLIEAHQPARALELLDKVINADACSPVDHAWLLVHRARCLAELGLLESALQEAILVQGLRNTYPHDPTAMAIIGAAADLIFTASSWNTESIVNAVAGRDTLAAWWRTQEVAWGFQDKAQEDFKNWANGTTVSAGKSDETRLHLRAASLMCGFAADHGAWRATISQLAQRIMTTADRDVESLVSALNLMRVTGDDDAIKRSVCHLLESGPVAAILQAAGGIDLNEATRTSLLAEMEFVRRAADILTAEDAERHMRWAIAILEKPSVLIEKFSPTFSVVGHILDMLAALVPALPKNVLPVVINHIAALAPLEDQAIAHGYAGVVRNIPGDAWSDSDRKSLSLRKSDNFEFSDEIQVVLAASDAAHRQNLQDLIARGDFSALEAFGDVRDLAGDTVASFIDDLTEKIANQIAGLKSGRSAISTISLGATLVMINCWHPTHARWEPILDLLATTDVFTHHLSSPLRHLRSLGSMVPVNVANDLEPILRSIMHMPTRRRFFSEPELRGDAARALEAVRPLAVTDNELWDLMHGDKDERAAVVFVMGQRMRAEDINALAILALDPSPWVRSVVANQLAHWIDRGVAAESASALLLRILDTGGTLVAEAVAGRLTGLARTDTIDLILDRLREHVSADVRAQVGRYFASGFPESKTSKSSAPVGVTESVAPTGKAIYTHGRCRIKHKTADVAARCRKG